MMFIPTGQILNVDVLGAELLPQCMAERVRGNAGAGLILLGFGICSRAHLDICET
jgi:hypothetical protein